MEIAVSPSLRGRLVLTVAVAFGLISLAAAWHFYRRYRALAEQVAALHGSLRDQFLTYYYSTDVWGTNTRWLGIPSEQIPTDNWEMQEIITEVKPDYIIEGGTAYGGTTLFYAVVLGLVNKSGKVITVDTAPHVEQASRLEPWKERVELITGDSVAPEVTEHIAREVAGKKVLVTLDDLHTYDHVLKELEIYSKMASPGSYLVVQDTSANGHPLLPHFGPGPMEAEREFLKTHHDFVIDHTCEKFMLTLYPSGWLKRVK